MHPVSQDSGSFVDFAMVKKTAGDYTSLTSSTWANVDTSLDLVVAARAGDYIFVSLSALHGSAAQQHFIDCAIIVAGAVQHSVGSGEITTTTGEGIMGWGKESGTLSWVQGAATVPYLVQSNDVVNGTVTLRLRYRASGAVTLYASAGNPLFFWAMVLRRQA